jgi:hypothetical protein
MPMEVGVLGLVDLAHATFADLVDDPVVGKSFADHQLRSSLTDCIPTWRGGLYMTVGEKGLEALGVPPPTPAGTEAGRFLT